MSNKEPGTTSKKDPGECIQVSGFVFAVSSCTCIRRIICYKQQDLHVANISDVGDFVAGSSKWVASTLYATQNAHVHVM